MTGAVKEEIPAVQAVQEEVTEESALIGGDPFNEVAGEVQEEVSDKEITKESAEVSKAPIFRGIQKDFTDVGELSEYTLGLERRVLEQEAKLSGFLPQSSQQTAPAAATSAEEQNFHAQIAEEFILNPKSAMQKMEERIRNSILGDVGKQTARDTFFKSFYEEHEDLTGCEDLVDLALQKNQDKWKNVPLVEAKKLLAHEVRSRVAAIRGKVDSGITVQTLAQKPAHTFTTGGLTPPKTSSAKVETLGSLVTDIKAFQAKRKKRV